MAHKSGNKIFLERQLNRINALLIFSIPSIVNLFSIIQLICPKCESETREAHTHTHTSESVKWTGGMKYNSINFQSANYSREGAQVANSDARFTIRRTLTHKDISLGVESVVPTN